jgi:hypothetical protein
MSEKAATVDFNPRYFDVQVQSDRVAISFTRSLGRYIGLRERRSEVRHLVHSCLKEFGIVVLVDGAEISGVIDSFGYFSEALQRLDNRLDVLAERPMSSAQVQKVLRITSAERSRWTKDGRLRQYGSSLIRRGQLVALKTYAPEDIAYLAERPELIGQWREQDAAHAAYLGRGRSPENIS